MLQGSVLGDWQALVDEEGNVYYWNPTTNRTSWNPPSDNRPSTPTLDLEHLPHVNQLNISPSSADSTKKFDYVNIVNVHILICLGIIVPYPKRFYRERRITQ